MSDDEGKVLPLIVFLPRGQRYSGSAWSCVVGSIICTILLGQRNYKDGSMRKKNRSAPAVIPLENSSLTVSITIYYFHNRQRLKDG